MKWTKTSGPHEYSVYEMGPWAIRQMDATARGRYVWLIERDGEPVRQASRYGARLVAGASLLDPEEDEMGKMNAHDWVRTDAYGCVEDVARLGVEGATRYNCELAMEQGHDIDHAEMRDALLTLRNEWRS
jgi:hypothetical protein